MLIDWIVLFFLCVRTHGIVTQFSWQGSPGQMLIPNFDYVGMFRGPGCRPTAVRSRFSRSRPLIIGLMVLEWLSNSNSYKKIVVFEPLLPAFGRDERNARDWLLTTIVASCLHDPRLNYFNCKVLSKRSVRSPDHGVSPRHGDITYVRVFFLPFLFFFIFAGTLTALTFCRRWRRWRLSRSVGLLLKLFFWRLILHVKPW